MNSKTTLGTWALKAFCSQCWDSELLFPLGYSRSILENCHHPLSEVLLACLVPLLSCMNLWTKVSQSDIYSLSLSPSVNFEFGSRWARTGAGVDGVASSKWQQGHVTPDRVLRLTLFLSSLRMFLPLRHPHQVPVLPCAWGRGGDGSKWDKVKVITDFVLPGTRLTALKSFSH